ncbi:hypothetical protein SDC9_152798 [bioreactor metagenome]|uniref:Uncharacterized protein n=1 Tax=bioreactor metagenome TaxID=1076179 RepID=A0A645EUL6_9ZZZZ
MVCVQIHRACALTCSELIRIRKRIFQHFHYRDHPRGLVLNAFNGRTCLAQVGEQKCHAAAAFGELKCGVDRPTNRLHVVFNTQQEAGDQLAALLFTAV